MNRPEPLVLVVEDELQIRRFVADALRRDGYGAEEAASAGQGLAVAGAMAPDLIVLDLGLPDFGGLEFIRRIRDWSRVPILILSARSAEQDKIAALDAGADDYLAKPFSPRELLARLHALVRRARPAPSSADSPTTIGSAEQRQFGPFVVDLAARRLLRNGKEEHLTGAEFDLLRLLVERPNRVLSRDNLVDLLKGFDRDPFDRSIDIRVTRLRRKIEANPSAPAYIRTVRGQGYLFNPRGEQT